MNKKTKVLLGFSASGFCLWLTLRNFDFHVLLKSLRDGRWAWFGPVILIYLFGHVVRSLRWQIILFPVKKISPFKLFQILMFGFLMNNILPARAGELARAYAGNKMTGVETSTFLGSVALERIADLFGLVVAMSLAVTILPVDKLPFAIILKILGGGIVVALVSLLFYKKCGSSNNSDASHWKNRLVGFLAGLSRVFLALRSIQTILLVIGLSIAIWMIEAGTIYFMSRVFELNLTFFQSAALLVGIAVGVMIPAAPGFVGTYEFFARQTLVWLGFQANSALSFILVLHFFQLFLNSLLGLPLLFKIGFINSKNTELVPSEPS